LIWRNVEQQALETYMIYTANAMRVHSEARTRVEQTDSTLQASLLLMETHISSERSSDRLVTFFTSHGYIQLAFSFK